MTIQKSDSLDFGSLLYTVTHRIPNPGWYSDSILCQSRTLEYWTIRKPDNRVRFASLDRFGMNKIFVTTIKRSRLAEYFFGSHLVLTI